MILQQLWPLPIHNAQDYDMSLMGNLRNNNYNNNSSITNHPSNLEPAACVLLWAWPAVEFLSDLPTITMQRRKGPATGSLPTFIHCIIVIACNATYPSDSSNNQSVQIHNTRG